jgi:hypothetical protein
LHYTNARSKYLVSWYHLHKRLCYCTSCHYTIIYLPNSTFLYMSPKTYITIIVSQNIRTVISASWKEERRRTGCMRWCQESQPHCLLYLSWQCDRHRSANSMSVSSNLPPLSTSGVFSVSASIIIDAPRDKVWNVLLDFPKYHEWFVFLLSTVTELWVTMTQGTHSCKNL